MNLFYQIYEFSQGDTPETGAVPYGVRLNGCMTWEQVPPVIKEAKRYLEDQLLNREVRPESCVFGLLFSDYKSENQAVWYALVAVAHLDRDRFGRPLVMFRYFWCESEPDDFQCLQAILVWFAKLKQIPRWSLKDQLYLEPSSVYQVRKPVQALPNPKILRSSLLEPSYGQKLQPWAVLQHLNRDVLTTYWVLKQQDPKGSYPVAWAWNVADLKDVKDFFIKPVDEVAYQKFKPRVLLMVQPKPVSPPASEEHTPRKASVVSSTATPHTHPNPTTQSSSSSTRSINVKDALKIISEKFSSDLQYSSNLNSLSQALQALDSELKECSPNQLLGDFRDLGCDRAWWEKAKKNEVRFDSKFGLLFLWTLLLPLETIDKKYNIDHLLDFLTNNPQAQEKFKQFLRAIRKAFLEPNPLDLSQSQNLTPITASLLDLTCFFFGKLFINDRTSYNSKDTKKLQALFKTLLQEPSWSDCLGIALHYCTQYLNSKEVASTETFKSESKEWQDFETTLRRHIDRYHENWNQHQETYQKLIDQYPIGGQGYRNQCYQQWPKVYRAKKQSLFLWTPLFKNSGILAALEKYNKTVRKEEEWWAQRWQALVDHLDQGYSTIKNWPKDQVLPGRLVFVQQQPYVASLLGQTKHHVNHTIETVTGFGNGDSQPIEQQRSIKERSDQQDDQQQNKWWWEPIPLPPHVYGAIMVGIMFAGAVGVLFKTVFSPKPSQINPVVAQSVLQYINTTLGFPAGSINLTNQAQSSSPIVQPETLASALSQTLGESQPDVVIQAFNGSLTIGTDSNKLFQQLGNYQQRMGIVEKEGQFSELADSLLCLTLDRHRNSYPNGISITAADLTQEIPVCDEKSLFIDRQMYIATDRFWFGEILEWTQQQAQQAGVNDAQNQLIQFLQRFDTQLSDRVQFSPKDPVKQRQLLQVFYNYAKSDRENGALGISKGLTQPETQTKEVSDLRTSATFLCTFANTQQLSLSRCPSRDSNPIIQVRPTSSPTAIPQTEDIYGSAPDDVKSFVKSYSLLFSRDEKEVLEEVKLKLGIDEKVDVPASVWKTKIRSFQRENNLPEDGEISPGGTTEAFLEMSIFGQYKEKEKEEEGIRAIW